jgi:hypothetical protein
MLIAINRARPAYPDGVKSITDDMLVVARPPLPEANRRHGSRSPFSQASRCNRTLRTCVPP